MIKNEQWNNSDETFDNLIMIFNNYSEFNPEQRVKDLLETCFSEAMLTESPIKNIAGSIASFSLSLSLYLAENNLSYSNFIESLMLSSDRTSLLLEFEYDFSIIKPIGGPTSLSNKPINKSLIIMYSSAILAICSSLGEIGTFIQPFVDIQTNILEKEMKEIDQQIEIEKLIQHKKSLEQKDRELDLIEKSLHIEKNKQHTLDNMINPI